MKDIKLIFSVLFFICTFLLSSNHATHAQTSAQKQECVDSITGRIVRSLTTESYSDPSSLMNTMKPDGTWDGIDYQDQHSNTGGWSPSKHFNNLKTMAIAYRNPKSPYHLNAALREKIILGCEFVTKWDYPKDLDNWWYNDIGNPQSYMVPLILMKNHVGTDSLKKYSVFLRDLTDNASHRGKNRTWVSEISIYKACIEDNYALLEKAHNSMASVLDIVPTIFPINGEESKEEGIKNDFSFFQHRRQVQSASYGFSFIGDVTNSILRASGTLVENCFTPQKRETLSSLLLEGHLLFSYRNVMDFGTRGRNIAGNGSLSMPDSEIDQMILIDPENAETFTAWKQHKKGDVFPKPGNKYFWNAYIMTHHGANYYLSAKVISKRSNGTEYINGENSKGYNLPLGATNILAHGKEYEGKYTDNIYAIWDWTRVPGTTAALSQSYADLSGYHYGTNEFGGGASDGNFGVIAYEHDYKNLKAKKAYFFMGDVMFCMGNGITASHNEPVATSVNQCFASGLMKYSKGDADLNLSGETTADDIRWAWHDGVGYIFPESGNITLKYATQTGSWRSINASGSTATISNQVASLWINHGNKPQNATYQYMVVPDKTLSEFKSYTENTGFEVIRNDNKVQALKNDQQKRMAAVFYTADSVNTGFGFSVYSNKAAFVLIEKNDAEYKISVADPNYVTNNTIILLIGKELNGNSVIIVDGKSRISVRLPSGQQTGATITNIYTEKNTSKEDIVYSDKLKMHLNQETNQLNIINDQLGIREVKITDMHGRIADCRTGEQEKVIRMSTKKWAKGIYLVTVKKEEEFLTQKIIKY